MLNRWALIRVGRILSLQVAGYACQVDFSPDGRYFSLLKYTVIYCNMLKFVTTL